MSKLLISLPESLFDQVMSRAAGLGLQSPREYTVRLIEADVANHERVERLALEGLDSGERIEVTDIWWAERHAELERRRVRRQAP